MILKPMEEDHQHLVIQTISKEMVTSLTQLAQTNSLGYQVMELKQHLTTQESQQLIQLVSTTQTKSVTTS